VTDQRESARREACALYLGLQSPYDRESQVRWKLEWRNVFALLEIIGRLAWRLSDGEGAGKYDIPILLQMEGMLTGLYKGDEKAKT
jgi:hypothetical protein